MRARTLLSIAQRLTPRASSGDLILAYHLVGAGTQSPVDLSLPLFERQLDKLMRSFDVCTLADALNPSRDRSASRPCAVLTFDDAYANFGEVVWPVLRSRGLPAVLYAPVGFVRGDAPPPLTGACLRACSFSDLRALADEGVEIGSHGVNHLNLRRVNDAVLSEELAESRRELELALGRPVTSFCYPQAKHDARVERETAKHYQSAVTAGGHRYTAQDRFRIPRFPVRRDEPDFDAMLRTRLWLREAIASRVRQWR